MAHLRHAYSDAQRREREGPFPSRTSTKAILQGEMTFTGNLKGRIGGRSTGYDLSATVTAHEITGRIGAAVLAS